MLYLLLHIVIKWNWLYVLPSVCFHPWDSTIVEDEALGRKCSLKRFLSIKLNFQLRKAIFLINDCCFPQQIIILLLAFSGQKISGHDASMQDTGGRDYHLGCSSFCNSHTVPACVLYVRAVWLASTSQHKLLGGSISHLEISRETKIGILIKETAFQLIIWISHVRHSVLWRGDYANFALSLGSINQCHWIRDRESDAMAMGHLSKLKF